MISQLKFLSLHHRHIVIAFKKNTSINESCHDESYEEGPLLDNSGHVEKMNRYSKKVFEKEVIQRRLQTCVPPQSTYIFLYLFK